MHFRHTGDTGVDQENYYESRHRYSLSDMITHIKRSIPDLRSIKHHPLENKESPSDSPKHLPHQRLSSDKQTTSDHQHHYAQDDLQRSSFEKDTEAVTLSAIQSTSCTCGAKSSTDPTMTVDKSAVAPDNLENFPPSTHTSSHHHQPAHATLEMR